MANTGWVADAFRWGRRIFILVKGIAILYFAGKSIIRYRQTRNKLVSFETAILFGIIVLDLVIMAFEMHHDVNLIFTVFLINSFM